jgi:hypothetical protein
VPNGDALRDVLALRADDLDDFLLEQLGQHAEADADAQGEQPFLGRPDQLAEGLLHPRRQRELLASDLVERYGLHGGSSSCRLTISHSPRSRSDRTRREDRHLKFYELRDNLSRRAPQSARVRALTSSAGRPAQGHPRGAPSRSSTEGHHRSYRAPGRVGVRSSPFQTERRLASRAGDDLVNGGD